MENVFKVARAKKGWTQTEAAKQLGMKKQQYEQYENGKNAFKQVG